MYQLNLWKIRTSFRALSDASVEVTTKPISLGAADISPNNSNGNRKNKDVPML